ncbi:MAG: hypothetical protein RLZZ292_1522 [Bacteroidota bacterium]
MLFLTSKERRNDKIVTNNANDKEEEDNYPYRIRRYNDSFDALLPFLRNKDKAEWNVYFLLST